MRRVSGLRFLAVFANLSGRRWPVLQIQIYYDPKFPRVEGPLMPKHLPPRARLLTVSNMLTRNHV